MTLGFSELETNQRKERRQAVKKKNLCGENDIQRHPLKLQETSAMI